jgi:TP901 family phage tail tape measure protein
VADRTIRTILTLNASGFTSGAQQASRAAQDAAKAMLQAEQASQRAQNAMGKGKVDASGWKQAGQDAKAGGDAMDAAGDSAKSGSDKATAGAEQASQATAEASKAQQTHALVMSDSWKTVGNALTGFGAAVSGGMGLAVKAAIDWESAWTGVTKTVDGSDKQMAVLEGQLRGLAKTLPATHEQIAAVAEAAGQLGIERGNVAEFTKVMIDLGETTNLSAEEAATSLARFSNIMGTSQGDVDRLGAALVGLGNNYATTEAEIMQMSLRLAGTGAQVGISEGQVMGLAAAMSSVGIEAESGGTSMSQGMKKIQAAVDEGSDSLEGFAEVAGMSADEFQKLWADDPAAGLDAFVQGLGRVKEEGGNVSSILSDLGIKGIREQDTFLRLAGASDVLTGALKMGSDEFEKNTALVAEAAKRYDTTESKIKIAMNGIKDAGIDLGASLLPAIQNVAEGAVSLAEAFSNLPGPVKSAVGIFATLTGGAALLGGSVMKAVPGIVKTAEAFKTLQASGSPIPGVLGKVGKGALAVSAAFAATAAISEYGDSLTDFSLSGTDAARTALKLKDAADPLSVAFEGMGMDADLANQSTGQLAGGLDALANGRWWDSIQDAGTNITNTFGANNATFEEQRARLEELGQALGGLAQTDLPSAQEAFQSLAGQMGGSQEVVENLLKTMPAYRDALLTTAEANGMATDEATLYGLAMGDIQPAAQGAADGMSGMGDAAEGATGAIEDQSAALGELQDMLSETASVLLGQRSAMRDYESALDDATASVKENGRTLDINTEKGRANESALDAIADSALGAAEGMQEAGDSAGEIGDFMEGARGKFIDTAVAMGMSKDKASDLADELQLLPDAYDQIPDEVSTDVKADGAKEADADVQQFTGTVMDVPDDKQVVVGADIIDASTAILDLRSAIDNTTGTVKINGNAMNGQQTLETLINQIDDSNGYLTINGETVPAEQALDTVLDLVRSGEGTISIKGDSGPAKDATDSAKVYADGSTGTVTIDGNNAPAKGIVKGAVAFANAATGTVTVDGNNKPANAKTDAAKNKADRTKGTVTVDGNNAPANAKTDAAKSKADRTTGTVRVDADAAKANSDINNAARSRTAHVHVVASGLANLGARIRSAMGKADGGWVSDGLAGGGWVPGPYPGAGVDNVLWPVAPGAANGRALTQPLAGTEFVVNGQSAKQWGPALEAMNAGMKPADVVAQAASMPGVEIHFHEVGGEAAELAATKVYRKIMSNVRLP